MSYLGFSNVTEDFQILAKFYKYANLFPDHPNNTFIPPLLLNPNYVPVRQKDAVTPVIIATTFTSTLIVLARLLVRRFHRMQTLGPDDQVMIVALAFSIGL
jgi:hypothetical protein